MRSDCRLDACDVDYCGVWRRIWLGRWDATTDCYAGLNGAIDLSHNTAGSPSRLFQLNLWKDISLAILGEPSRAVGRLSLGLRVSCLCCNDRRLPCVCAVSRTR